MREGTVEKLRLDVPDIFEMGDNLLPIPDRSYASPLSEVGGRVRLLERPTHRTLGLNAQT